MLRTGHTKPTPAKSRVIRLRKARNGPNRMIQPAVDAPIAIRYPVTSASASTALAHSAACCMHAASPKSTATTGCSRFFLPPSPMLLFFSLA